MTAVGAAGMAAAAPSGRLGPALMIPGPASLRTEDLQVLGSAVAPHYGSVWVRRHAAVLASLQEVLGSAAPPYLLPGTGTTALEAAILNFLPPGATVVVPDTGYFGQRLAAIARAHGMAVRAVAVPLGEPVDPARVAAVAGGADGVLCVHVESATGVRHPVRAIARAAAETGAVCVVDGVASAGGEHVDVTGMGIDVFATASQKGLEGPPGLGIVALGVHGRTRLAERRWQPPSWHLDLAVWERHRIEDASWEPHPVTMPTNVVLALAASLRRIHGAGVAARVDARARLATELRRGLAELGLPPIARPGAGSHLVVAAWADDAPALVEHLAAREGIAITTGLGPLRDRAIRIGLLGATASPYWVERVLCGLRAALGA